MQFEGRVALPRLWLAGPGVLVLAVALILRGYDLLALPIFTDEATFLRWSADIYDHRTWMSLFIPVAEDGKQPLFIWFASAAMTVFSDPLLAGRVVSVVAGLLSTIGLLAAGRWLDDDLLGLLTAFLYAVVPYTLIYDRMALADSWVGAMAIWTFALSVFIAKRVEEWRTSIGSGIALGMVMAVGVWVKSTALFILPFPLLCALFLWRGSRSLRPTVLGLSAAYLVFGALALLLVAMPYADSQMRLFSTHVYSPGQLSGSLPMGTWIASASGYVDWMRAYLPMPLYPLVLVAGVWALAFHTRQAILLLGCWAAVMVPSIALAQFFASRYVIHSVFLLLFLVALMCKSAGGWLAHLRGDVSKRQHRGKLAMGASWVLVIAVTLSSLAFDLRLLTEPSSAPWEVSDRSQYIEGWPSGYGFQEAVEVALQRAGELDRDVFILSDHFQGLAHDGLALYIRGKPRIHHYVDGRIIWGEPGLLDAWRSHKVPLIIVRNDGRFKPEQFEARVPEARRIAVFWKPGGVNSFRVYEISAQGSDSGG